MRLVQVHGQLDIGILALAEFEKLVEALLDGSVEAAAFLNDKSLMLANAEPHTQSGVHCILCTRLA